MRLFSYVALIAATLVCATSSFAVELSDADLVAIHAKGQRLFSDNARFWIFSLKGTTAHIEGIASGDGINYEISEDIDKEVLKKMIVRVEDEATPDLLKQFKQYSDKHQRLQSGTAVFRIERLHGQRAYIHGYVTSDGLNFEIAEWASIIELGKDIRVIP